MNKSSKYEINHIDQNIIVTKSFLKAAGILNTPEYKELMEIRRDYPEYPIVLREIKKKADKKSYRNLTFENMRGFIVELKGADSAAVQQFDKVMKLAKAQAGRYAYVKTWFLDNFKAEYETAQKALEEAA